jgi:hypothetical protein
LSPALLRFCSDQQQMSMRKIPARARHLYIEPTSHIGDWVCFLFSRYNCDSVLDLVQVYPEQL